MTTDWAEGVQVVEFLRVPVVICGLIGALALPASSKTVGADALTEWHYKCGDGVCTASAFVTDVENPNLSIGVFFTSVDGKESTLRFFAPLGSNLDNGVAVDLNGKELGKQDFTSCPRVGCYADVELNKWDWVPFLGADEIGITVWDADGTPFRVAMTTEGLRPRLKELFLMQPDEGSVLVASAINPSIVANANLQFSAISAAGGCRPFPIPEASVKMAIRDQETISEYINVSNSVMTSSISKLSKEDSFVYSNLRLKIEHSSDELASKYAKRVDLKKVNISSDVEAFLKAKDSKCYSHAVYVNSRDIDLIRSDFLPFGQTAVYSANLVREDGDGSAISNEQAADYALRAFSSKVMERVLETSYGVKLTLP